MNNAEFEAEYIIIKNNYQAILDNMVANQAQNILPDIELTIARGMFFLMELMHWILS